MATLNYVQGNLNYEESQANYLKRMQATWATL